jgi:hypothetical protein
MECHSQIEKQEVSFLSLIKPETLQNIGTEILNPELLLLFNSLKSVQSSDTCHFPFMLITFMSEFSYFHPPRQVM